MNDLKKIWDQKLKESGFEDIEINFQYHSLYFKKGHSVLLEKQAYYEKALSFLNEYDFDSQLESDIWKLHAGGSTVREIADKLQITHYKSQSVVERLREIMMKAIL